MNAYVGGVNKFIIIVIKIIITSLLFVPSLEEDIMAEIRMKCDWLDRKFNCENILC